MLTLSRRSSASRSKSPLEPRKTPRRFRALRDQILSALPFTRYALVAAFLCTQLVRSAGPLAAQVQLPFAVNSWSDAPLLVQIYRRATGQAAYFDPQGADSFTYGPFYTWFVQFIDGFLEPIPHAATLHSISAWFAILGGVPLGFAIFGLTLRRNAAAEHRTTAYAVTILGVLAYYTAMTRSLVVTSLHPDALITLMTFGALACLAWLPRVKWPELLIGTMAVLLFACSLTKITGLITAFCFFAALFVRRELSLKTAALCAGSVLVAFWVYYIVAPRAVFEWTIVIPTQQYFTPQQGFSVLWREIEHRGVYEVCLALIVIGGITVSVLRGRYREALADGLILLGPLAAGMIALLKVGGGAYDLFPALYFATALGAKYVFDLMIRINRAPMRGAVGATLFTAVLLAAVGWSSFGEDTLPAAPALGMVANLQSTATRLNSLCAPGKTIVVGGFPDPLLDCPGATFPLWNSYLEIQWARPRGYAVQTVLNHPMSPDVVVMIEGDPINVDLVGSYAVSSVPYHRGFGSSYTGEKILIYEKYSNTSN
jgi:hypothetical protein